MTIHFHALLHAPTLKQTRFKITASQPFDAVVQSLRKKLKLRESEGVWCYVGNFSPGGDEGVGGLWKVCFERRAFFFNIGVLRFLDGRNGWLTGHTVF